MVVLHAVPVAHSGIAFSADWLCETTRCSTGLARQAWASARRSICEWRGRSIAVYLLPKLLLVRKTGGPFGALRWPRSLGWLGAVSSADGDGLMNCSVWVQPPPSSSNRSLASVVRSWAVSVSGTPSLLLADLQV